MERKINKTKRGSQSTEAHNTELFERGRALLKQSNSGGESRMNYLLSLIPLRMLPSRYAWARAIRIRRNTYFLAVATRNTPTAPEAM